MLVLFQLVEVMSVMYIWTKTYQRSINIVCGICLVQVIWPLFSFFNLPNARFTSQKHWFLGLFQLLEVRMVHIATKTSQRSRPSIRHLFWWSETTVVLISFESTKCMAYIPKILVSGIIPATGGPGGQYVSTKPSQRLRFSHVDLVCFIVKMTVLLSFESTLCIEQHLI